MVTFREVRANDNDGSRWMYQCFPAENYDIDSVLFVPRHYKTLFRGFPTRFVTNPVLQPQKMAIGLEFLIRDCIFYVTKKVLICAFVFADAKWQFFS